VRTFVARGRVEERLSWRTGLEGAGYKREPREAQEGPKKDPRETQEHRQERLCYGAVELWRDGVGVPRLWKCHFGSECIQQEGLGVLSRKS
jgi:hypothetical protein